MMTESKTCLTCGKGLRGRSDKKFCDDYCRNNFNNKLKAVDNNYVRNITNTLKKNRRILRELLPETGGVARTTREALIQAGFQFRYGTHSYTNKKGCTYFYCYEYGYLQMENDRILVVKRREGA